MHMDKLLHLGVTASATHWLISSTI